jgi:hypothetical protein
MGIARVFLGLAKAHQRQGVGTSIPVARKGSCETGRRSGKVRLFRTHSFPARPDVHSPPQRRALAFLGFWVRRAPQSAAANRHRVSSHPAKRTRVAPRANFAANSLRRAEPCVTGISSRRTADERATANVVAQLGDRLPRRTGRECEHISHAWPGTWLYRYQPNITSPPSSMAFVPDPTCRLNPMRLPLDDGRTSADRRPDIIQQT